MFVISFLPRRYVEGDEGYEGNLRVALVIRAGCSGDGIYPSVVPQAVSKASTMGNERTATKRVNVVRGDLEKCFEREVTRRTFRDSRGRYRQGPAEVVTKALIVVLYVPDYKNKAVYKLSMQGR